MLTYLWILIFAVFALHCDNEQPLRATQSGTTTVINQEDQVRAVTARSAYYIREQIRITIHNGSDSVLYIPTCSRQISYYIQQNVKGRWEDSGANGLPCIGYNIPGTITILPGKSYVYNDAIVHFGLFRYRYPVTLGRGKTFWLYTNDITVDGR